MTIVIETFSFLGNVSFIALDDFNTKAEMFEKLIGTDQDQFAEPFKEMWKKLFATAAYIVLITGGFIMLSFVKYEVQGKAAHYRTALNQLNSWIFLIVSFSWSLSYLKNK